jgi:NADH dehydrogenase
MKILVTGGTGVVGTAAVPELLRAGHTVRLLSRHADEDTPAFPDGVEPFPAQIEMPGQLEGAAEGCDAVLHIAGIVEEHPPEVTFERINVAGTQNLLDTAAKSGAPAFIFLSSLGADAGQSAYHKSKRDAEELVRRYPGRWLILRAGNVYGPGDETISMLLKMTRTLPAVPMVGEGDQPFQPIWFTDLGRVILQALEDPSLTNETLEVAGPDVTTTADILNRLERMTGRQPPRLAVPVWLTEVGMQAVEGLGGFGKRLLERARVSLPINSSKLSMLIEENVIEDPARNALTSRFEIQPTSLQEGLEMLVDMLPEQTPGDGFGAIHWSKYWADIHGTSLSPEAVLDRMCERVNDVMPIEFAAEPGVPESAEEGHTLTAEIPGRGHIQVRVEERTPTSVTFATVEGHPLAGLVRFEVTSIREGVRFSVNIAAQPANLFDWIAMRTLGGAMQSSNWRAVVRRMVELSGGTAPGGVQKESGTLDDREAEELQAWAKTIVQRQQRIQKENPAPASRLAASLAR